MQTLAQIRSILEARGLRPRRALGQNFLIDKNLLIRLVEAACIGPGARVLEIGPGTGTLTEALLERGARVVACELDAGLCDLLRERLAGPIADKRLVLIEGDALGPGRRVRDDVLAAVGEGAFSLVSNLPYGAATPVILSLLSATPACETLAVTVQKEVADRLIAGPGSKDYGTLGIVAQAVAGVDFIARLPPECFWPRPEVTSAMVLLKRRTTPMTSDAPGLIKFCQRLFSARRKQLGSTLGRDFRWPTGTAPGQRPEELSVAQIIALWKVCQR